MQNIALIGVLAGAIAILLTLIQPHLSTSFAQAGITGKFCNVQQNSGWWLWFTIDNSTDPCGIILDRYCSGPGCRVVSSGTYSLTGKNDVRVS
ncbi:hypothetical protein [Argonema galeatum]|uniref:hypothetical protein n=1 Tax=Argonema galeatum TaxID=2942762 RepID=UPI0020112745|nr:hypothetical protein [Argonema galeatum]